MSSAINYFTNLFQQLRNNKETVVYKHMTLLQHVSVYDGHLQGGGFQRK